MLPYSVVLTNSNTPQIIIVGDAFMPKPWQKSHTCKCITTLQSLNRQATVISSKYLLELTKFNRNFVKKATVMKDEKLTVSMRLAEKSMTFILSSNAMILGEKVTRRKKAGENR